MPIGRMPAALDLLARASDQSSRTAARRALTECDAHGVQDESACVRVQFESGLLDGQQQAALQVEGQVLDSGVDRLAVYS